jgi:hypothetical protein
MKHSIEDFSTIASLDLDPIKVKLMHEESGEAWSLKQANAVEFEYRRFLYLMKKFPNEPTAPRFDVDIFWHYHILDTMKYAVDCDIVFGYFLHHFPYVGLRGEADLEAHHEVGERMRELYEETFGEPYVRQPAQDAALAGPAFSSATTKAAFSSATTEPAFSSATAKVAFSSATGKATFSSSHPKVAFSSATIGPAFSSATTRVAFSSATAMKASGRANASSDSKAPAHTGDGRRHIANANSFYTARPTLVAL